MKHVKIILVLFMLGLFFQANAQKKQVMIITTIEYAEFLSGANSKMFITFPDGNQQEVELNGLFPISGFLSERKIKRNDKTVADKINEFVNQGWEVEHASAAIRDGEKGQSVVFTRYILIKKN